jgi:hypothetical protein
MRIDEFSHLDEVKNNDRFREIPAGRTGIGILSDSFVSRIIEEYRKAEDNETVLSGVFYQSDDGWKVSSGGFKDKIHPPDVVPMNENDRIEKNIERMYVQIRPENGSLSKEQFCAYNLFAVEEVRQVGSSDFFGRKIIPARPEIEPYLNEESYDFVRTYLSNCVVFAEKPENVSYPSKDLDNSQKYLWVKELCRSKAGDLTHSETHKEKIDRLIDNCPVVDHRGDRDNLFIHLDERRESREEMYDLIRECVVPIIEPLSKIPD